MSVEDTDFDGTPSGAQALAMIDSAMGGDEPQREHEEPAPESEPQQADSDSDSTEEQEPAADPASDDEQQEQQKTTDSGQPSPEPYVAPSIENAHEQIEEINAKLDALFEKYDEGEIDRSEYRAQEKALNAKLRQIESEQRIAEHSEKFAEHMQRQAWTAAQNRFFESNKAWRDNPVRYSALDSAVRAVWGEESSQGKSHDWILNEAKSRIERAFGMNAEPVKADAKPKPKAAPAAIPSSLTDMPGSPAAGATEFETVSNKDPLSMLDDVMSWSEEKRAQWLDRRI